MRDLSPVVVSGFGTVNAAGCGRQATAAAFRDSAVSWQEVDRSAGYHRRDSSRLAGLTAGLDLSPWLSRAASRRMSLPSKLAVAATRMALQDADLKIEPEHRAAVVASNPFGPSSWVEKLLLQTFDEGPTAASPALFTETVANAPAAQVAMACQANGANVTVTQREAGGLIALLWAANEIVTGRSACALVVAVDEVTPALHAALDRFKALARPGPDGRELARPFDRHRNGFLSAEGATTLVLERADDVRRRGGRILARLHSATSAFDPRAPKIGWSRSSEHLAAALVRFLKKSGVAPAEVDAVVSGASGARAGDALEAKVLKAVWGAEEMPPVLAPKAVLGEHSGVVLAAAVLALDGISFAPTPGFREADPELDLVPYDGRPLKPRRLLVSCLGAGGSAAWTLLEGGRP